MHPVKWFVCALLVVALPSLASAQTADIVGRVTDNSGGVLPGVTVTAENIGTKDVRTAVTQTPATMCSPCCRSAPIRCGSSSKASQTQTSRAVADQRRPHPRGWRMHVGTISETVQVTG